MSLFFVQVNRIIGSQNYQLMTSYESYEVPYKIYLKSPFDADKP